MTTVTLTPITMKHFKKLVRNHIISTLLPRLDPHQFAYRANKAMEDAIVIALHSALSHLEQLGSYAWLHFVAFNLAFNTILPNRRDQTVNLGISHSICLWIKNLLFDHPQRVSCQRGVRKIIRP